MSMLFALVDTPSLDDEALAALDAEASRARERALQADLRRLREQRPGSGVCADAYNRLSREMAVMGRPLGGLRENSADPAERFFARTVPGPDGHVYWTGAKEFYDGRPGARTRPVRWWWNHVYGTCRSSYDILTPTCGDGACINPEHQELGRRSRALFTEQQMIGKVQVLALRLGHPPSTYEWKRSGISPTDAIYVLRFGSWEKALHAAGFTEYRSLTKQATRDDALAGIRYVHEQTGAWPSREAYERHGDALQARGLPRSGTTVMQFFGGRWPPAIAAARAET